MENIVRYGGLARDKGVRAGAGSTNGTANENPPVTTARHAASGSNTCADHFVEREGLRFAGTHLLLDLWDATNLNDLGTVERALRRAAQVAGATLLRIDLHDFAPTGGITGVAVLAESHISIHTWPERAYAAIDVFMCGEARPHAAIEVLRQAFQPGTVTLVEHKRGLT